MVVADERTEMLDDVFLALGHPMRRQILLRLREGSATVTDIAEPFPTSLNAVSKHLKVLERAGLIRRDVVGRQHYCSVAPLRLDEAREWLDHYRAFWTSRLDALEEDLRARKRLQSPPERG